jgi:hypothetical protein
MGPKPAPDDLPHLNTRLVGFVKYICTIFMFKPKTQGTRTVAGEFSVQSNVRNRNSSGKEG